MATSEVKSKETSRHGTLPPLEPGDRLDQPTFHARYEAMPEDVRAELIGGIVYMPAALRVPHGRYHGLLMMWVGMYSTATSGTQFLDNATVILGDDSEPQPDASLTIVGGQSQVNEDLYLVGAPEFVAEVASSSESYDLHAKREDYERLGVQEYLVLVVRQQRAVWFVREEDRFTEMSPAQDGVLRSQLFPGLWLDPVAFFAEDGKRVQDVLNEGLATAEHADFVRRLGSK